MIIVGSSCVYVGHTVAQHRYISFLLFFDLPFSNLQKSLASESWNAAVLDSGATNMVAGKEWYNCYISSLSLDKKTNVWCHKRNNTYQYGDGNLFTAIEKVDIPLVLGK